jgi:Icc-related predicted phosphoesterase
MRIFAVADLHGSQYRMNLLLGQVASLKPDLVVVCGDITQFGPAETATRLLNQIPVRTLAVPGNIDSPDVGDGITASRAENIDRRRVYIDGVPFVGLGDLLPSSLVSVTVRDGSLLRSVEDCVDVSTVLVTHVPPHKTRDKMALGPHAGSKSLRRLVEEREPRLVLCGHIHEDPGVAMVGRTTVVNCSLGRRGEGAVVDLGETVAVRMLD